jgi:sn-glycerol 3-phosphate transport system ATP-binding protein
MRIVFGLRAWLVGGSSTRPDNSRPVTNVTVERAGRQCRALIGCWLRWVISLRTEIGCDSHCFATAVIAVDPDGAQHDGALLGEPVREVGMCNLLRDSPSSTIDGWDSLGSDNLAAIALENVTKTWGGSRGVDRISFTTDAGKFLVLLGPSGCGKSTTLRLIAGLEQADAGRILIAGDDVTALPPSRRHLSMVFQSYALFPHLSVAENILFGLKVRHASVDDQRRGLDRVASLLGLSALLERKPNQLSGGQQQRVALGRAIIAEKPVCLMDEPLSNLDAQLRNDMRRELRALQQALGMTMVYVTHDQAEAMSMADQVILLRDGGIEQDATPDEMYARPATMFAARFIGTPPMNVIAGSALAAGSPLWAARMGDRAAGVAIGVRPEDIMISDRTDAVRATIASVEYLGADSVVTCTLTGDATLAVRAKGKLLRRAGEEIGLDWDPLATHDFDSTTGRRLPAPAWGGTA